VNAKASTPEPAAEFPKPASRKRLGYLKWLAGCLLGVLLVFGIALNPFHRGYLTPGKEFRAAGEIAIVLNQYAKQNGKYPDGNSSTEVFQKLLDGNYLSDPSIFYLPSPGKIKAVPGQSLKPENVSWDVTCCMVPDDSDLLPLVFITGCKVNYVPGGSAVALATPLPAFYDDHLTWIQQWNHDTLISARGRLVVIYKGNNCVGYKLDANGVVPNFISPNWNTYGKTYRQLTPVGPLH
jgi:hypothetical protein